jgi:protein-L-isoaspartate(D-aspartate) O-methyltransferase
MPDPAEFSIAREKMVDSQVRPNQVHDRRVIGAMRALPREAFAPAGALAYSDADLPLGGGRYMLCPMVTARLVQLVMAGSPEHVLVVGAGSGYAAALLSACGAVVVALEEEHRLCNDALGRYAPNVIQAQGKLIAGWPSAGPYDAILIEGAVPRIPEIFAAQLAAGGRVVTILAQSDEAYGLGRAVVAEPSGNGTFASAPVFDCAARPLPAFRRAPEFSF